MTLDLFVHAKQSGRLSVIKSPIGIIELGKLLAWLGDRHPFLMFNGDFHHEN